MWFCLYKQVHAVAAAALRARRPQCRSRACPGNPANSIPRRIRRDPGNRRHRLGAAVPSYNFPGSKPPSKIHRRLQSPPRALSGVSHAAPSISPRPARSHRRPFGASSPCRKNEQEHCMFTWEWRPQRLPASLPRQQVSSRAQRSHSTSSSDSPHAYTHTLNHHQHLSLTLTRQISAARGPQFAASLLHSHSQRSAATPSRITLPSPPAPALTASTPQLASLPAVWPASALLVARLTLTQIPALASSPNSRREFPSAPVTSAPLPANSLPRAVP